MGEISTVCALLGPRQAGVIFPSKKAIHSGNAQTPIDERHDEPRISDMILESILLIFSTFFSSSLKPVIIAKLR
ncbi:hypothetical protein [Phyllobacterium lublinensis]|uniref:hypothetical protein n=1 Tax=Phyllobacterium lublinensis TaxID=2875708 RepID=UPI001CCE0159|nr:hypothetical protein [Phyllobacterium sp. 2063]MBZ9656092.1 hypothetical protein [Phyllobacterium sp. 2063]